MRPPHVTGPALPCPTARWCPAARGGVSLGGMSQHQPTSASQPHPWARPRSPPGLCGSPSPAPGTLNTPTRLQQIPEAKQRSPPEPSTVLTHTQRAQAAPLWNCPLEFLLLARARTKNFSSLGCGAGWGCRGCRRRSRALGPWRQREAAPAGRSGAWDSGVRGRILVSSQNHVVRFLELNVPAFPA